MKTSLFDFILPESLIATEPAEPRDTARMLVVADEFRDQTISDLPKLLKPGDVMVFNDTRVIPARLLGTCGHAKVEVLLHKRCHPERSEGSPPIVGDSSATPQNDRMYWQCFAKPAKRLRIGEMVRFADDFSAYVLDKLEGGEVLLEFSDDDFYAKLSRYGQMPLPPYIQKKRKSVIARSINDEAIQPATAVLEQDKAGSPRFARDDNNYQTIYARHSGSVAAPTAGLHFTSELLAAIDAAGVKRVHVTLHVGGGTFLPVKAENTEDHVMHSEYAEISAEAADTINKARAAGGRVIAVGTTSLRTLESAADENGALKPFQGETNIFITPGYRFKTVELLLTNFHLPRSTLFMLVSAFSGLERMQATYAHAIAQKYRFYSYGDACFLHVKAH